jgi:sugar lactone lactonase YvrE
VKNFLSRSARLGAALTCLAASACALDAAPTDGSYPIVVGAPAGLAPLATSPPAMPPAGVVSPTTGSTTTTTTASTTTTTTQVGGTRPNPASGVIMAFAGTGTVGGAGDGGQATAAQLNFPNDMAVAGDGTVYIADSRNHRIRKVDVNGAISTVAGNGTQGFGGDGGPATNALLNTPVGMALDGAGNLFFTDHFNHVIRRVDRATGTISTIAGTPGQKGYAGDGGPATAAKFDNPEGLAFDKNGNLLVADFFNNRIRRIAGGVVTTIAGNGGGGTGGDGGPASTATLGTPAQMAVGADGSIYVSSIWNARIRRIAPDGTISTYAGGTPGFAGDGGSRADARFNFPDGLAIDGAGNLYIADQANARVRRIAANGAVSTVAGSGASASSGDGGPAVNAGLKVDGLAIDHRGDLLVTEGDNHRVRIVGL